MPIGRLWSAVLLMMVLAVPGIILRFAGVHPAPIFGAAIFGLSILAAAFILSWAAETAEMDISQGLALAIIAFIAVLPEYAVDLVLAWKAGADPIVVTPPSGTPLWMTVRWTTPEGKPVEHCVEDMVFDLGKQKAVADCSWVYLGGRMAQIYKNDPEVYVADLEGNLVSICYLSPDNHLGTMVHQQARDDQNWWTTTLVPPAGTEVEFVFHKAETPLHQERSKRLAKEAAEAAKDGKDKEGKDGKDGKDD